MPTLTADSGAFDLISIDLRLLRHLLIGIAKERKTFSIYDSPPAVASTAVVGLKALKKFNVGIGKYLESGQQLTFRLKLPASLRQFIINGQIVNLKINHKLTSLSGSYNLNSPSIIFRINIPLTSLSGSYNLSSPSVNLLDDRTLVVSNLSILVGQNADLLVHEILQLDSSSYNLDSQTELQYNHYLEAERSEYLLTGSDVNLSSDQVLTNESQNFNLYGQELSLEHDYKLNSIFAQFILNGQNITLEIVSSYGQYHFIGSNVNLLRNRLLNVIKGLYDLIAIDSDLYTTGLHNYILNAFIGQYILFGTHVGIEIIMEPYITINEADDYFDTRLNSSKWENISESRKLKALLTSTRIINSLRFKGSKVDSLQENEFPRIIYNEEGTLIPLESIPNDIKIACAEIAYALLSGIDPEEEIKNLSAESRSYAATKVIYNRTFVHEYLRAGVPSAIAWNYLRPYLASPLDQILVRIG